MRRHAPFFVIVIIPLLVLVSPAMSDWPTDPQSPLVVGELELAFGPRHSMVRADDDAVWVAWQDSLCTGSVRLQRIDADGTLLSPLGIKAQKDPTCAFHLPPVLAPIGNSVVVSRALSSMELYPVQRFGQEGDLVWPMGFSHPQPLSLSDVVRLKSGDALVVSTGFGTVHADRVDENGRLVWGKQAVAASGAGANFRVFAVVPEPSGGAYILWDSPLAYTRLILASRVTADGDFAWDEPVRFFDLPFGDTSSRHSDPVAIGDGVGGVVVIWTKGFETGTTPAPLLIQRIGYDGAIAFPMDGLRVSLGANRQFDVGVQSDAASGDLLVVWRDGQQADMGVRAQRLSLSGDRLWGDEGVEVAPLDLLGGSFDLLWGNDRLAVAVGGETGVVIHNLDSQGHATPNPWVISGETRAIGVRMAGSGDGIVASWQDDETIVAQRVNPDGRLGDLPCGQADLNGDGLLNFFDVSEFLVAFLAGDPAADFTGDGVFNFFDVSAFLGAFTAGCP